MLGISPWVPVLIILAAAAFARRLPSRWSCSVEALLNGRAIVVLVAVTSALLCLWVWGSLTGTPVIHDESAYLLQAELFAHFHWTGLRPPIPEFFEQLHVLVDRALASKYPPGNSLILAPGALIGLPALPVVIMSGCSSSLIFVLARRMAGGAVGLLTWVVWESSFPMIYYHANYMSEGVSGLTWLLTWWGIARWRDGEGRKWLTIAGIAVAWCLITRPLTGLALGIVALAVVLWRCRTTGAWRDLALATPWAIAVLAIVPLWNWRTTGDVRIMPLTEYTKMYAPFDKPGLGVRDAERPSARLPLDQARIQEAFFQEHARHTLRALPKIAWQRAMMLDRDEWYEWRGGLRMFALVGMLALSVEGWILFAAFALQFVVYLAYAHPAWWTIYYVEGMPLLAFVTALGIQRVVTIVAGRTAGVHAGWRLKDFLERLRPLTGRPTGDPRYASPILAIAICGAVAGCVVARQVKSTVRDDHAYYDRFARLVGQIPERRAVVFVRYGEKHLDGLSLVRNPPDGDGARVWTVYDRGADNARLLALAPGRTPYLFDETSWTMRRITLPGDSAAKPVASASSTSLRERREAPRLR